MRGSREDARLDAEPSRRPRGAAARGIRRGGDRRWHHGRRRRVRCRHARVLGRARGARRLLVRHLEPLVEDDPRRPAVPAELRPRAGARGTRGASADGAAGAAPGEAAPVSGAGVRGRAPGHAHRHGSEHVRRDVAAQSAGAPPRRPRGGAGGKRVLEPRPAPHDRPRRAAGAGPRAGRAGPVLRVPLLRLPDRRFQAGPDGARRGGALRGRVRQRGTGRGADRGGRQGGRRRVPGAGDGRALCRRGRERRERDGSLGGPDPARGAARRRRTCR